MKLLPTNKALLDSLLSEVDLAFLDIETTGFDALKERVVEVGIVKVDRDGTVSTYETLVNPQRHFSNHDIHGVTPEMILCAPKFEEVADDIVEHLAGRVVVVFNATFDLRFISSQFDRLGIRMPEVVGVCAMALTGSTTTSKIGKKLDDVCRAFGIEQADSHKALEDARAVRALFGRLIGRLGPKVKVRDLDPTVFNLGVSAPPGMQHRPTNFTREDSKNGAQSAACATDFPWTREQLPGKIVVLSGDFNGEDGLGLSRKAADIVFKGFGLDVKGGVSKKVDFLIVDNLSSQSGKCVKARELSIPMYLEERFWSAMS